MAKKADDPLAELAAKYGDAAPVAGGAHKSDRPLRAAPSGIPSVDYAIGIGGVPRGTIMEVFGPEASGKTFMALTFSAYAQRKGGQVGFVDAEHKLQPTFAALPGVDLDTMHYAQPSHGEEALNMTRDWVSTGLFDVWTVDSVHALTPQKFLRGDINAELPAELAKLMSSGAQVLDAVVAKTDTLLIFINHIKQKPMVKFGRDWYTPGGNALDYYSTTRLSVKPTVTFQNKQKRRIGHRIKIKVEKSGVSAPFGEAEYDLYYRQDVVGGASGDGPCPRKGQLVSPGVDLDSCWLSVLKASNTVSWIGNGYFLTDPLTGEKGERVGTEQELIEALADSNSALSQRARKLVYGGGYVE